MVPASFQSNLNCCSESGLWTLNLCPACNDRPCYTGNIQYFFHIPFMRALSGTHLSKSNSHWGMLLALAPGIGCSMEHMKVTPAWSANFFKFLCVSCLLKRKTRNQNNTIGRILNIQTGLCWLCCMCVIVICLLRWVDFFKGKQQ